MEIENPGTVQTIKSRYCPSKKLFDFFSHSTSTSMFDNAIFFERRCSGQIGKSIDRCLVLKGAETNLEFLKNLKYGWFLVKQIEIISGEYLVLIILNVSLREHKGNIPELDSTKRTQRQIPLHLYILLGQIERISSN